MSRIALADHRNAHAEPETLLDVRQSRRGMLPNDVQALAHLPTALQAFRGLRGVTTEAEIDFLQVERGGA